MQTRIDDEEKATARVAKGGVMDMMWVGGFITGVGVGLCLMSALFVWFLRN